MDVSGEWSVAGSFENKSILVTGASGFLGKVLVEKLLYSTPQIKNIYLLIRPYKNQAPKARLEKILHSPIFNRIRCSNEELLKKLVPIAGDLMEENLGLNEADMRQLCDQVAIVFHCAATVKFDEMLKVSIQMNVIGTQRLVALCHKMTQLISMVHTSTAYANCDLEKTEEKIYVPRIKPSKLIEATSWMDDSLLDTLTPHLLGRRPNTYTFAKALAESQLIEDAQGLPVIIVRPSIIGAIWREPLPGWTDNVNGPTGLLAACGKGVLTNMCGSVQAKADIIPVDVVSNALIAAAAQRANSKSDQVSVIHCASGVLNPLKWNKVAIYIEQFYKKYPLNNCLHVPSAQFHATRKMFLLHFYLKHYIPAYVLDIILRIIRRKPQFVKTYGKVWRMIETLHYFTCRGWDFESSNILKLWENLSEADKKTYNFDVRQVNWDQYLFDYLMGIKVYLLKEKLEDLPIARKHLSWRRQFDLYMNGAFWALIVRLFVWRRTRKQKWTVWLMGFMLTYACQNVSFRPRVYLKSLEEYKKTALPIYAH